MWSTKITNSKYSPYLLYGAAILVWLPSIWAFFMDLSTLVQTSVLLIPFIVFVQKPQEYSYRYFIITLLFVALYLVFPFQILLVFIWWYSFYALVEISHGKLNKVAMVDLT